MKFENEAVLMKSKRIEAGLRQADLKKALKFTTSQFISNIERGVANVPVKRIKAVAKLLKFDPQVLIEMKVRDYRTYLQNEIKGVK